MPTVLELASALALPLQMHLATDVVFQSAWQSQTVLALVSQGPHSNALSGSGCNAW